MDEIIICLNKQKSNLFEPKIQYKFFRDVLPRCFIRPNLIEQ
jgi:hypothetical protein